MGLSGLVKSISTFSANAFVSLWPHWKISLHRHLYSSEEWYWWPEGKSTLLFTLTAVSTPGYRIRRCWMYVAGNVKEGKETHRGDHKSTHACLSYPCILCITWSVILYHAHHCKSEFFNGCTKPATPTKRVGGVWEILGISGMMVLNKFSQLWELVTWLVTSSPHSDSLCSSLCRVQVRCSMLELYLVGYSWGVPHA